MKALWWFKENQIAGMARPGFNACHWFDMPFDEAIFMGWLGQHSGGTLPLSQFQQHVKTYLPQAAPFYHLSNEQIQQATEDFQRPEFLNSLLQRLIKRTQFFQSAEASEDSVQFQIHMSQFEAEVNHLKKHGIDCVVTLTESHHLKEELQSHFDLHHIGIIDMGAPTLDQAKQLADILDQTEQRQEKVAVHCLAGIGRTSTMLMAAKILRGEKLEDLLQHIAKQNPSYVFTGSQAAFLKSIVATL